MIFRRVKAHIANEDWFAVFIDFIIVVFGVYIGMQVSNWIEELRERGIEARTIDRLHTEVNALVEERSRLKGFNTSIRDGVDSSMRVLFELDARTDLSPRECFAITISHVYASPPDDLPVIEEMISAGRIDILRDAGVRDALSNFIRSRDRGRNNLASVRSQAQILASTHADLIAAKMIANETTSELEARTFCHTAEMRLDQRFLNDLIGNRARFLIYYESSFELVDPELTNLKTKIEENLEHRLNSSF